MKCWLNILLGAIILLSGCEATTEKKLVKTTSVKQQKAPVAAPSDTITIAAVGDMMLGTSYPDSTTLPADSGKSTFKHAEKYLREADVAFGNLEGVLLDSGAPVNYKLNFRSKGYFFRTPVKYARIFKDAGFKVLSLGNNHSNDFDRAGRRSTVKILDSLGLYYAGFKNHPSATFTVHGVKYGFCAFSPNGQTVSLLETANAKAIIKDLKEKSDVVIVSFHGGGEGVEFEHVPEKTEIFKGENRGNLRAFTHAAIDAGADVVLGHGPHVSRAMELYKKRLIAYSLGNFSTYKGVSVAGICGMAPLLKLHINKKGEFIDGRIISFRQTHENGLKPDTLNGALKRIKALTETDFTQSGLTFTPAGVIIPAQNN